MDSASKHVLEEKSEASNSLSLLLENETSLQNKKSQDSSTPNSSAEKHQEGTTHVLYDSCVPTDKEVRIVMKQILEKRSKPVFTKSELALQQKWKKEEEDHPEEAALKPQWEDLFDQILFLETKKYLLRERLQTIRSLPGLSLQVRNHFDTDFLA